MFFSDQTMASTGRKLDPVWSEFDRIAPNKARCRKCPYEVAPLVDRMKKHISKVHMTAPQPAIEEPKSKQPRITQYACSTTTEQKKQLDLDIGRFFLKQHSFPSSRVVSL